MPTTLEHAEILSAIRYIAAFSLTDGMRLMSSAELRANARAVRLLSSTLSTELKNGTGHLWDLDHLALFAPMDTTLNA